MESFIIIAATIVIALTIVFSYPALRKALGILLIIAGTIAVLTFFGAIVGIPMIVIGGIMLFVGDNSAESDSNNDVEDEREECPYCAELIKRNAKICRFCGKDLPENFGKIFDEICPYCKKAIEKFLENCPHCNSEMYVCDNCQSYVRKEDRSCTTCGAYLGDSLVTSIKEKVKGIFMK